MNMTIEETLDEVEKHWDTDRTEAARAIMRYAEAMKPSHIEPVDVEELGRVVEISDPTDPYMPSITRFDPNEANKQIVAKLNEVIEYLNKQV